MQTAITLLAMSILKSEPVVVKPKGFAIVVNGKTTAWAKQTISFEETVHLAYPTAAKEFDCIIGYNRAGTAGTLRREDKKIRIRNGMTFTIEAPRI